MGLGATVDGGEHTQEVAMTPKARHHAVSTGTSVKEVGVGLAGSVVH